MTEKNIVLRSRTIIIKKLTFLEKDKILKDLLSKHNRSLNKHESFIKIFDFFCLECVDDMGFRGKKLLDAIKNKLNEAAVLNTYGWELSSKYMRLIFPRSARNEYILLRSKKNEINNEINNEIKRIKYQHSMNYVRWVCLRSPTRAFINVMNFIGSSYYCK